MRRPYRLMETHIWFYAILVQIVPLTTHHSPLTIPLHAEDSLPDSIMYHDPELPQAKIAHVFPEHLMPAWLDALHRPEADYQSRPALTILLAHKEGLHGTTAAIEPLLETLARPEQKDMVRLAAAQALIELDAQQSASQLFQQAQAGDHDLRDLIEPALAKWKFQPAREIWLERLRRPETIPGDLVLALRGLAALKVIEAIPSLTDLVQSRQASWPIRLEAARALGEIKTSGSESDARGLAADPAPNAAGARLAASWLLRHHQGGETTKILQTLARDAEPAVAAVALERLLEMDPKLVMPAIDVVLASPDAKVRSFGVEALCRDPTVERLPLLAARLDDPHPDVRTKARQSLFDLGTKASFRDSVIREGMKVLYGRNWRGLEQTTFLLGQLDHKPAAGRLVELLKFDRPEVLIAAGWGLRRLAVPETLPNALEHFLSIVRIAQANQKSRKPQALPLEAWDQQLSHLAQFMGQFRYQPAEPAFRAQIPRIRKGPVEAPILGQESRAASVWAMGWLYEGKADPQLARQLEDRLKDVPKRMDPGENPRVRRMSAIALGRMKSNSSLDVLKSFHWKLPTLDPVSHACGWSIQQLTGEAPPPPGTVTFPAGTFKNWLRTLPEPKSGG